MTRMIGTPRRTGHSDDDLPKFEVTSSDSWVCLQILTPTNRMILKGGQCCTVNLPEATECAFCHQVKDPQFSRLVVKG